jgi:Lsr2
MSREVRVIKHDDLDGSLEADETIRFVYEGVRYGIDLCTANADAFRAFIQPYLDAAFEREKLKESLETVAQVPEGRKGTALPDGVRDDIREWLQRNGVEMEMLPTRIIPYEIRSDYYDATGDERVLTPYLNKWREKRERDRIREWAAARGTPCPTGNIPEHIIRSYHKAHGNGRARQLAGLEPAGQKAKDAAIQDPAERKRIRMWARTHGFNLGTKGFIPTEIQEAYAKAHQRNGVAV